MPSPAHRGHRTGAPVITRNSARDSSCDVPVERRDQRGSRRLADTTRTSQVVESSPEAQLVAGAAEAVPRHYAEGSRSDRTLPRATRGLKGVDEGRSSRQPPVCSTRGTRLGAQDEPDRARNTRHLARLSTWSTTGRSQPARACSSPSRCRRREASAAVTVRQGRDSGAAEAPTCVSSICKADRPSSRCSVGNGRHPRASGDSITARAGTSSCIGDHAQEPDTGGMGAYSPRCLSCAPATSQQLSGAS